MHSQTLLLLYILPNIENFLVPNNCASNKKVITHINYMPESKGARAEGRGGEGSLEKTKKQLHTRNMFQKSTNYTP
jgi:hypothetical protein